MDRKEILALEGQALSETVAVHVNILMSAAAAGPVLMPCPVITLKKNLSAVTSPTG